MIKAIGHREISAASQREIDEAEELGCADCAAPNDGTWPVGSDICTRCWEQAEAELDDDAGDGKTA